MRVPPVDIKLRPLPRPLAFYCTRCLWHDTTPNSSAKKYGHSIVCHGTPNIICLSTCDTIVHCGCIPVCYGMTSSSGAPQRH